MMRVAKNSVAFLFGFGFAFFPALGPLFAGVIFLAGKFRFKSHDIAWIVTALAMALSFVPSGGWRGAGFGVLQVVGPWLVFVAFRQMSEIRSKQFAGYFVGLGLLVGFTMVVVSALFQLESLNYQYKTLSQAVTWSTSPALYGHTVLVLGSLISIVSKRPLFRVLAMSLAALGILFSGSREAALAWLVLSCFLLFVHFNKKQLRIWLVELALFLSVLMLTVGLGRFLGWGEVGFLLDLNLTSQATNLIQGSEIPQGDWWDSSWVSYENRQALIGDTEFTAYSVQKKGNEAWHRLQQVIPIEAGLTYTMSAWINEVGESPYQPGLQGWGQDTASKSSVAVISHLTQGAFYSTSQGQVKVLSAGIAAQEADWKRVFVSFRYEGKQSPLYWYVGLAPDNQLSNQTESEFAGFQFEQGDLTEYKAGSATRGLSFSVARKPYWQAAWQGVKQKPLLGWGQASFPEVYETTLSNSQKLSEVPTHAHNLYWHVWLEQGLLGLFALLLLIGTLSFQALRLHDSAFLLVFGLILAVNIFDVSLFSGSILYPLSALAGWRTTKINVESLNERLRPLLVRGVLVATDYMLAFALLGLLSFALFGTGEGVFNQPVALSLLLVPLLIWRSGLYPGYGLAASEELRRHITSISYAAVIIIMGSLIFQDLFTLSWRLILVFLPMAWLFLPVSRYCSKSLLARTRYWGNKVIILGAEDTAQTVARALLRNPLGGLKPVAFFDDFAEFKSQPSDGVFVEGRIEDAKAYARENSISQVIIAVAEPPADLLTDVITLQNKIFRKVQVIPDISGMPVQGIAAGSVDRLLALEIPVQLASTLNRGIKLVFDLFCVSLGGLLISPFLLLIALAVYIDSPGPIFFGHKRVGQGGKSFKAWKFRTMVVNAEERLEDYLEAHPELREEWEQNRKLQSDPRITRLGAFLRKYSLDEFPQLLNVLTGEMSLVGPRPIVQAEVDYYKESFELYKLVRPGLTGYWQVSGRSETNYPYRVSLDSFYVRNWSIWLDIVILARTPLVVLKGEGAY